MTQIILTGFPLFLFILFTISIFIFALVAAILIGVLVAVLFTLFMVGVALVVVLPTIFFTTMAATFLFLWGLGGYYFLKWVNKGGLPAPQGKAVGDAINNLTGGKLGFLMDGIRGQPTDSGSEKKRGAGQPHKLEKRKGESGFSSGSDVAKSVSSTAKDTTENGVPDADGVKNKVDGITKQSGNLPGAADTAKGAPNVNGAKQQVDGVTKKAGNLSGTTNTAKGALGGATGLA